MMTNMRRGLIVCFSFICFMANAQELKLAGFVCDGHENPVGIAQGRPSFGWQLVSRQRNIVQTHFRLWVSDSKQTLASGKGNIWDSGKKPSPSSVHVPYEGTALKPATTYFWRVQSWDNPGNTSPLGEVQQFTTGLFSESDWAGAKWIGYEEMADNMRVRPGIHGNGNNLGEKSLKRSVAPLFRKQFAIAKKVSSAIIYISGLGQYEFEVNGKKYGEDFLSPGWTDYDKTCLYNSYDVTDRLQSGTNAIGVIVGNGFYYINRERYRKLVTAFGMPKMICRLVIRFTDGSMQSVVSGSDWKTAPSPLTYNSIYGGEDYDAGLEQNGWSDAGFNDSKWKNALAVKAPTGKLKAEDNYAIRVNQTIDVKTISNPKAGTYVYDFGQNASGIIEISVQGKKGDTVKLIPAELINDKQLANQKNTGGPFYFFYTLKGNGVETWRPRFTYYGFRYVQVDGAGPDTANAAGAKIKKISFLHTSTVAPRQGTFTSSNELFNRAFTLIDWGIKSNLQSVVTDCPHREKLSWLEQDHLMGGSIHYNYDVYPLYRKLIRDMIDAQTSDGLIPDIAPEYVEFDKGFRDSPEWGSAGVILPWMLYVWYGDKEIIREAYPMMKKYVEYLQKKSEANILDYGLGDWYDLGPKFPGIAQLTPVALTATASYYYDAALLSRMSGILQMQQDSVKYATLAGQIKTAFNQKFFNTQNRVYSTGSQTAMAMPLVVGLVDEKYKAAVLKNLTDTIYANGKSLTAGDVGFHYLVKALADNNGSQLLFEMNNRDDVPGYGFQLKKGATALTESWAALREVSNNHLMLGHLMEWFYSGLGGITSEEDAIAFNRLIIRPNPVGDLTFTNCSFVSPYGKITSNWKKSAKRFELDVTIPANSSATIYLPASANAVCTESGKSIAQIKWIRQKASAEGKIVLETGSGIYHFTVTEN